MSNVDLNSFDFSSLERPSEKIRELLSKIEGVESGANNYKHPTGDGNLHVPSIGNKVDGHFLKINSGEPQWVIPTKKDVGLNNVDNTSDSAKPVSTHQQKAIASAKAEAIAYANELIATYGSTHYVTTDVDGKAVVNWTEKIKKIVSNNPTTFLSIVVPKKTENFELELENVSECEVVTTEGDYCFDILTEAPYHYLLRCDSEDLTDFDSWSYWQFKTVVSKDELDLGIVKTIDNAEQTTNKGMPNGYAGLDENEKIFKKNLDVYDFVARYEAVEVNEYDGVDTGDTALWVEQVQTYTVPYIVNGAASTEETASGLVMLPKCTNYTVTFNESNASSWSSGSYNYKMAKIDVADLVGKSVKMYGFSRSAANYPLAFFVDENYAVLSRHGLDNNTLYGYTSTSENTNVKDAVEAIIPEGAKYVYIIGTITSGYYDAIPKIEVLKDLGFIPSETYKRMQSPLWGKKLYVDGDSICYGNGYKGGFGKIIADRYNMKLVNKGVGGASVCSNTGNVKVDYGELDWEHNPTYYLGLTYSIPSSESNYQDGFRVLLTEDIYNNGFGVYPICYKFVNGEIVEQPYTETMPTNCKWYVKFDIPTYDGNTVEKYVAMWAYPQSDGTYTTPETTGNRWLWEAYKSGFASAHELGYANIATARHWLSTSVEDIPSDADYIIFEGGINDYLLNRRLGEITEDYTSAVDTTTVIGGMEYICRQLLEKGAGKKVLFVLTHKSNAHVYTKNILGGVTKYKTWTDYHDAILSVLRKYSIPCVDLFNNSAFNTELESYKQFTSNKDGVHPTKEGYELFYVPQIVSALESGIGNGVMSKVSADMLSEEVKEELQAYIDETILNGEW